MDREVALYVGAALGKYGFPNGHPFGPDRQDAFWKETLKQGLDKQALLAEPRARHAPKSNAFTPRITRPRPAAVRAWPWLDRLR